MRVTVLLLLRCDSYSASFLRRLEQRLLAWSCARLKKLLRADCLVSLATLAAETERYIT